MMMKHHLTQTFLNSACRAQGYALAEPSGPWYPTFALERLENLNFFIQIKCWAPLILQVQSTGHPSIFLRAQPW